MDYILNRVRLSDLSRHPLSIELYGYDLDRGFLASVKRHGIITPIQVTQDLVIIDGHKRYQAASDAGIKEARVLVRLDLNDELAIREALIECNRYRDRSADIKLHEKQVLQNIAADRARERELAGERREALAVGTAERETARFSQYWWDIE
jgi:ParB-like chromosome segregation protein Spo0J